MPTSFVNQTRDIGIEEKAVTSDLETVTQMDEKPEYVGGCPKTDV
jgi:hypothetical protein